MKALTIRQPWASLIAAGVKTIETRSWSTKYRGPLAIHAGKAAPCSVFAGRSVGEDHRVGDWQVWYAGAESPPVYCMTPATGGPTTILPLGAVVATCTLADVVRVTPHEMDVWEAGIGRLKDHDINQLPFGDFTPGRYVFLLDRITPIDPVPCRGKQGLWHLPSDIEETVLTDITPCEPVPAKGRQGLWNWQP